MRKKMLMGIVVLTSLLACKKSADRTCFKSAGVEGSKTIFVGMFNELDLGPNIRYLLVQDTVEKVVISGGENLLNMITTEISDHALSIRNTNICNFLRSYKKEVTAEIHLKMVDKIHFEGTKPLHCIGQLNLPNLYVVTKDGAGEFNLNVKSNVLRMVITNGWGNFNLTGETDYMKLDIRVNGSTNAYEMDVRDSLDVLSSSSGLVKVNVDEAKFRAQITSNGDIWFVGQPSSQEFNRYGEGNLIDKN